MDPFTKGIGKAIKPMAEADSYMPMGTYMKGSGKMIKHMATEATTIRMVRNMKVCGAKTNSTAQAKRLGPTAHSTRGPTKTV